MHSLADLANQSSRYLPAETGDAWLSWPTMTTPPYGTLDPAPMGASA